MGQIRIAGDTSGATSLAAPAIAGSAVITFPTVSGDALASTGINNSPANTAAQTKIAVNIGGTVYYLLASTNNT